MLEGDVVEPHLELEGDVLPLQPLRALHPLPVLREG